MPHEQVSLRLRANAKRMRRGMTEAEQRLWSQLRAHRLMGLGFRRQMPVGNYIADFACPEHKLIVELDGTQHAEEGQIKQDTMRTIRLGETGWVLVRFWNRDVMDDVDNVCNHIVDLIQERSPDAFR